jgi:hypothetical protein
MTIVLFQAINNSIAASVRLAVVDDLLEGALAGIVIGILVGAIVMPMVQAPDAIGRGLFFTILAAVGMSLYQLARIGTATGEQLGTILSAFTGPYTDALGEMMLEGIVLVLYSMLAGALVGVGSVVPDQVMKGGLVGLFLGAAVGALFQVVLGEFGVRLNPTLFRISIAAITWALFTAIVGGKED